MSGNDPLGNGQTQSRAFPLSFSGKKRIKNIGEDMFWNPRSVVGNLGRYKVRVFVGYGDLDPSPFGNRIKGIQE